MQNNRIHIGGESAGRKSSGQFGWLCLQVICSPRRKVCNQQDYPLLVGFCLFFPLLQELNPSRRSLNVGSTVVEGPQNYVLCWFIELFSFVIKMCHKLKGDKVLPVNHLLFEIETEVLMVLR